MSAYDDTNIFAKILRGEIPSHKVYEDEHTLAFMDVMPQANGHTLVIPKAPSRNLLDADLETLSRLMPVVQKIAVAAMAAFEADGVTSSSSTNRRPARPSTTCISMSSRAWKVQRCGRIRVRWKIRPSWPQMPKS